MKRALTMIELLVVIAIIAILAGIIVAGCEARIETYPTPKVQNSIEISSSVGNRLFLVEVGGHRFAVLDFGGRCAMCEVTDASKIKPESP